MTREEIKKQWLYDCNVACHNAMVRLKELEERKSVFLTEEEIEDVVFEISENTPNSVSMNDRHIALVEATVKKINEKYNQ